MYGEGGRAEWNGDTWDYRQIKAGGEVTEQDLLALLAQVGMEGWEMCAALTIGGAPFLVFKRRRSAIGSPDPRLLRRV